MKIRKFKHKKTDDIVKYYPETNTYTVQDNKCFIFEPKFIENTNDWEEIIEKDYEVLSLKYNHNIFSFKKGENYFSHKSCTGGYVNEKDILNEDIKYRASIHSVKRLSDGEIFTIGDNCSYGVITGIFITKEGYCMTGTANSPYSCNILYLKHNKQPLFKTEDGVDVFEGDEYFEVITPDFHNKPCIWNILPNKTRGNINYDQKGNKKHGRIWFSTKEKAEEYIDLNKPKYSLNDILSVAKDYYVMPQSFIDKLKQLNK